MVKGKVVLVPFPFDDLSGATARPAVCLTEPIGRHRHVVLAFITSQMPVDLLDSDLILDAADPEFRATVLRGTSVVRLHRLMTASTSLIQRQLGKLGAAMQTRLADKLRRLFSLE